MAGNRPWGECGVMEMDFKPDITSTNTYEKWKEWAEKENIFVKVKTNSTNARGDGLIEIQRCGANDTPIGILRALTGHPSNFPSKLVARVAVEAWEVNADGGDTGELADGDFGKEFKTDAQGKAVLAAGGDAADIKFGRVIGGTKQKMLLAFDLRDNFR